MTPEEWSQVRVYFDQALDLQGIQRTEFVACINSDSFRDEVKRLLALHESESL